MDSDELNDVVYDYE